MFTHSRKLKNFCQSEASEPAGFLCRGGWQGTEQAWERHDTYEVLSAACGDLLVRKLKGNFLVPRSPNMGQELCWGEWQQLEGGHRLRGRGASNSSSERSLSLASWHILWECFKPEAICSASCGSFFCWELIWPENTFFLLQAIFSLLCGHRNAFANLGQGQHMGRNRQLDVEEVMNSNTLVSCGSMMSFVWIQLFVDHTWTQSVNRLCYCRAAFNLDYLLSWTCSCAFIQFHSLYMLDLCDTGSPRRKNLVEIRCEHV